MARISWSVLATALVTLAPIAPAQAFTPTINVYDETTGQSCPDTTPGAIEGDMLRGTPPSAPADGGCVVAAAGELRLSLHVIGMETWVFDCEVDLEAHIDGTGEGWIDVATYTNHAGELNCGSVQPCETSPDTMQLWPVHIDEVRADELAFAFEVCFDDASTVRECELAVPVTETGTSTHLYEGTFTDLDATNHASLLNCEWDGQLHVGDPSEGHDEIEVEHL